MEPKFKHSIVGNDVIFLYLANQNDNPRRFQICRVRVASYALFNLWSEQERVSSGLIIITTFMQSAYIKNNKSFLQHELCKELYIVVCVTYGIVTPMDQDELWVSQSVEKTCVAHTKIWDGGHPMD